MREVAEYDKPRITVKAGVPVSVHTGNQRICMADLLSQEIKKAPLNVIKNTFSRLGLEASYNHLTKCTSWRKGRRSCAFESGKRVALIDDEFEVRIFSPLDALNIACHLRLGTYLHRR